MATRHRLTRAGLAALAATLVAFGAGPAAFSAGVIDDLAPEASNFQIWPEAVNATLSPQTLSVWIDLTDEGDGFGATGEVASVTVEHADAGAALTASFDAADLTSGNTYESELVVPAAAPTGTWRVTRVEVRDQAGNIRAYETTEALMGAVLDEIFETDTTLRRPTPPGDVDAVAGDGQANVTWSAPARDGGSLITSYIVRGSTEGDGDVEVVVDAPATATDVTGLENGKTYTFEVVATNGEGDSDTSDPSAPVVPAAPDVLPPAVSAFSVRPALVEVGSGDADVTVTVTVADPDSGIVDGGVTVTFRSPSSAESVAVTMGGAERIAGDDHDATFRSVVTVPEGAEAGRWTAEVAVADQAGNSAVVGPASLESAGFENGLDVEAHSVPGLPRGVSAAAGNGTVTLIWEGPESDGGRPVSGYAVEVLSGGEVVRSLTTAATVTATTVTGLTNGMAYSFTVAASNELGTGLAAPTDAVVPATRPDNPGNVRAAAGDQEATVTWNAPASDGGAPVTSYTITVREGGGASRVVAVDGSATGTVIGGLTNERTYRFAVAATNWAGPSAAVLSNGVVPTVATGPASAPTTTTTTMPAPPAPLARSGYWMLGAEGRVYQFGDAGAHGSPVDLLSRPAVDLEPTASGSGFWVVDDRGTVYGHGDAAWFGNVGATQLGIGETVTSLSRTHTGRGYWVFTSRGRVLPFGDAKFYGDVSGLTLNGPVLDSIPSPTGRGYFMVASDGGIFAFGDAVFRGSMGGKPLNAPVQSLVPDRDGVGYWLVASDGGVFAFDAAFRGSMGGTPLNRPVTGMVPFGNGYLMVGEDGGIFNFSDRPFVGSLGNTTVPRPIVAVAVLED